MGILAGGEVSVVPASVPCPVREEIMGEGATHFLIWNPAKGWVCNYCGRLRTDIIAEDRRP